MVLVDINLGNEKNDSPKSTAVDSHWSSLETALDQSDLTAPPPVNGLLTAPKSLDSLMTTTVVIDPQRILFTIDLSHEGVTNGFASANVLPLSDGFRVQIEQRELFKGATHGASAKRLIYRDYQIPNGSSYDWSHLSTGLTPDGCLHVSALGSATCFIVSSQIPLELCPPFSTRNLLEYRNMNNSRPVIGNCGCGCRRKRSICTHTQWIFNK